MAAIEDDGRTKTATDGTLSGKILCTLLTRARLATQKQRKTLLPEKSLSKVACHIKYLASNTLLILVHYKCKCNYTTTAAQHLYLAVSIYDC